MFLLNTFVSRPLQNFDCPNSRKKTLQVETIGCTNKIRLNKYQGESTINPNFKTKTVNFLSFLSLKCYIFSRFYNTVAFFIRGPLPS